jgi:site-specific DNA-adenine methylase
LNNKKRQICGCTCTLPLTTPKPLSSNDNNKSDDDKQNDLACICENSKTTLNKFIIDLNNEKSKSDLIEKIAKLIAQLAKDGNLLLF